MDTTDVLSSYFMIVDKHRFALMWLVYSRNKFFRVGSNISEEFVPGGTNFRGVQIKRDKRCKSRVQLEASEIGEIQAPVAHERRLL